MLEYLAICFVLYVILRAWKVSRLWREIDDHGRGEGPWGRW
jgi:hypothetical protein